MNYASVDKETYFDENEGDPCSIKQLGTDSYIRHPRFDAYLVSIVTAEWEWVGHPKDAPFKDISGKDWEWVAWNASFDERVYQHLQATGVISVEHKPRLWNCAADLSAFCAGPRALAQSCAYFYGEKVSKDYRQKMKGKLFAAVSPEVQEEVKEACLIDGRKTLRFWHDHNERWPEKERRISRLGREQGWYGLRVDLPAVERDIKHLKLICWAADNMLPWNASGTSLSYELLVVECKKAGIDAPPEINKNSEACAAWEDRHGDQYPWIDAMRTLRSANVFLKKLETMRDRVRPSDGRMSYANKYFAAHTGRYGDGNGDEGRGKETGFNSRNMTRKEVYGKEWLATPSGQKFAHLFPNGIQGVNMRNRIIPAPGCHFNPADLSAIEPTTLWVFSGDTGSLDLVRQGFSPYHAHATNTLGWEGEELKAAKETDPYAAGLYALAKARVIALGYGAGFVKFIFMAGLYISKDDCKHIFGAPVTKQQTDAFVDYIHKCRMPEWVALWKNANDEMRTTYVNSWMIVQDYRKKNPKIASRDPRNPGIWKKLDDAVKAAVGEDFEMELPSGRTMLYKNIALVDGDITGIVMQYGRPARKKLYGGLLTENLVQAVARDVFCECMLRIDDAGYWTALSVHDEAVVECPTDVPAQRIVELMSQPPEWLPNLPVRSECKSTMFYTK